MNLKTTVMLRSFSVFVFLILMNQAFSQVKVETDNDVGVGTLTPNNSAKLDVFSENKGFLLPRINFANIGSVQNPVIGLQVYCPDKGQVCTYTTLSANSNGWVCGTQVEAGNGISVTGDGSGQFPYQISTNSGSSGQTVGNIMTLLYSDLVDKTITPTSLNQEYLFTEIIIPNGADYSKLIVDVVFQSDATENGSNLPSYNFQWRIKNNGNLIEEYRENVLGQIVESPYPGQYRASGFTCLINDLGTTSTISIALEVDEDYYDPNYTNTSFADLKGILKEIKIYGVSNPVSTLVGPKGDQGDPGIPGPAGNDGPQGDPGLPGQNATLTIGNVTTGAPGSTANATITGVAPNQILNLTIPQGQNGQNGSNANIHLDNGNGINLVGDGSSNEPYTYSLNVQGEQGIQVTNAPITKVGILDNGVSTSKIQDNAVVSSKIANNAVTQIKITNNAINSSKIVDGTILGEDIANKTVTPIKIEPGELDQVLTTKNINGDVRATWQTVVDPSSTNELQTISTNGAAGNLTLSQGGGTISINVNDADANPSNEGVLSVQTGTPSNSIIQSNSNGGSQVILAEGQGIQLTESGNTITITGQDAWLVGGNNLDGPGKFGTLTPFSDISVVTNDIEKMRVTHGGNIGIGTSAPINKLHVKDPTATYVAKFEGSNGSIITVGDPLLTGQSNTVYQNATGQMWLGMDNAGNGSITTTAGAQGINFSTGGTEKMRILNNGNIGINVAQNDISAKLDVGGDVIVRQRTGTPSKIATFDVNGKLVEGGSVTGPIGQQLWLDNSANFPNSITTPSKVNIGDNGDGIGLLLSDLSINDADNNGTTNISLLKSGPNESGKSGFTLDGNALIAAEIYHHGAQSPLFSLGLPNQNSLTIKASVIKVDGVLRMGAGTKLSTSIFPDSVRIHKPLRDASGDLGNTSKVLSATMDGSPNWVDFDGSGTNELQTISSNGSPGNITLSNGGGTLNLNVDDADASLINEGVISVAAGTDNNSVLVSNTGNYMSNVTFSEGSGIQLTEVGNSIVITNDGDLDPSNDITTTTSASGDLSGTYPNPTVNKIQGIDVSTAAPTSNQVLKYNSTTSKWEPSTDIIGLTTETDPIVKAINGLVKSNGITISAAVSGTDYDPSSTNEIELPAQAANSGKFLSTNGTTPTWSTVTENDPVVKAINGLVKSNGTTISAAVSGTDYDPSSTNEIELPAQATHSGKFLTTNGTTPSWSSNYDPSSTNEIELPAQLNQSGKYLTTNGTTPAWSTVIETDPVVKAINGLVKSNGTTISAAVSGTDYDPSSNNEIQTLTLTGQTLGITGGNTVTLPVLPSATSSSLTLRSNGTSWESSTLLKNDASKVIIDNDATLSIPSVTNARLHVDGIVQIGKNTTQATTLIGTDVSNSIVNVPVRDAGLVVSNGSLSSVWAQLSTSATSTQNQTLSMSLTTTYAKMLIPNGTSTSQFTVANSSITLPNSSFLLGRYRINYSYCFSSATASNIVYESAIFAGASSASTELANTRTRKTVNNGDDCVNKEIIHDFGVTSQVVELKIKSSSATPVLIYSPVLSLEYVGPGAG